MVLPYPILYEYDARQKSKLNFPQNQKKKEDILYKKDSVQNHF